MLIKCYKYDNILDMKKIILAVIILGIGGASYASIIKPWREAYQVSSIKTSDQQTIEVYRFDDEKTSCYITSTYGVKSGSGISCVKN